MERAEGVFDALGLVQGLHANIDRDRGIGGNDVGGRSPSNRADIQRGAAFRVGDGLDFQNLTGHLDDRVDSLLGFNTRVRRAAGDLQVKPADSLARGLEATATQWWFQHQCVM